MNKEKIANLIRSGVVLLLVFIVLAVIGYYVAGNVLVPIGLGVVYVLAIISSVTSKDKTL